MKKLGVGMLMMAGIMAYVSVAVASEDVVILSAGQVFGKDKAVTLSTKKPETDFKSVEVICEEVDRFENPLWLRIITLGIVGATTDVTNVVKKSVPGGVEIVRLMVARNRDLDKLLGALISALSPRTVSSKGQCSSEGSDPIYFSYFTDGDGKQVVEVND